MTYRWIWNAFVRFIRPSSTKSFNAWKEDGDKLYREKKYSESVHNYNMALKINPSSYLVLANRSAAYLHLGKVSLALSDANTCIKLSPSFFKGYCRQAEALMKMGNYDKAAAAYRQGLSLSPHNEIMLEGLNKCNQNITNAKSTKQTNNGWSIVMTVLSVALLSFIQQSPLEHCNHTSVVDDSAEYKSIHMDDPLSKLFNSNFSRLRGVSIDKSNGAIVLLGEEDASNKTDFPGKLKPSDFATALLMAHENPSFEISYSLDEHDHDLYRKVFYPDISKSKYFQHSTLGFAIHDSDWFIKVLVNDIQYRVSNYGLRQYKTVFSRHIAHSKYKFPSSLSSIRLWWTVRVKALGVEVDSSTMHRLWINDDDIELYLSAHTIEKDSNGKRVDTEVNDLDPELISFIEWVNESIKDIINIVPEMFRLREVFVALEVAKYIVSVLPTELIDLHTMNRIFHTIEPLVVRDNGNYTVAKCRGVVKKTVSTGNGKTTFSSEVVGGVRLASSHALTPRIPFPSQFSIIIPKAAPGYSGISLTSSPQTPSRYHGSYHGLVQKMKAFGHHSHHVIPNWATSIPRLWGPAIEMEAKDHMALPSSKNDRSLLRSYKSLWDRGLYRDALHQGIKEVYGLFPGKYDRAVEDMTRFIYEARGKVDKVSKWLQF